MNLKAIADALAGRFVAVTATSGTESETETATADLPDAITKRALLVYPPIGVLDVGTSALRTDSYDFPIRLLRDPLSVPERTRWLYAWYDAMRDRVEMNVDLDLAYVASAQPIAARLELDGEEYAGSPFDVAELIVRVGLYEHVTTVGV